MSMDNFRIDDKNILVKYTGNEAHVVIPDHVRVIASQAFAYNTLLESVVIPEGVVTIGDRAFEECRNLERVEIPTSVSMIEKNAFSSCKKLTAVSIPEGVPFIASKTFYMCLSLKTVTLPSSVTSIGDEAFSRCISLEEIAIGDEVIEIGDKAFMECFALKAASIGRGVEVLRWKTFAQCRSLEKVALTGALRMIDIGVFDACPLLTDIYFDEPREIWHQINKKSTGNDVLRTVNLHENYTESILSTPVEEESVPKDYEDVLTETVEEPAPLVSEEETAMQLSFAIMDEVPVALPKATTEETVTVTDEAGDEKGEEFPIDQVTLPIEPVLSDDAATPIDETPTETLDETVIPEVPAIIDEPIVVEESVVVEEPVSLDVKPTPTTPKKTAVRMTPKSAQSTVSEEFKLGFYRNFLGKLGENTYEAITAKADAMTDESFETQSEALFLVPADDAYEFGCVCLLLGKYNMAFRSFLSAAGKGSVGAQYYVGAAFLFGIDTAKKVVDAARWLTKCKKDGVFGPDAERLLIIVDEELDKPENAGLKVKRGNK